MIKLRERTISSALAIRGATDQFVDLDEFNTDIEDLLGFLDASSLPMVFSRKGGNEAIGRAASAAGVTTHEMIVTGDAVDIDALCAAFGPR